MTRRWRPIVFMVAGIGLMTLNDAATKLLAETLPMGETLSLRGAVTLLLLAPFLRRGGAFIRIAAPRLQFWRGLLYATATVSFLGALTFLPLSTVVTVSFISPILIAALSGWTLGEHPSLRCWIGLALGFVGVATMVGFGAIALGAGVALALAAAFCDAGKDILTRRLAAIDTTIATFLVTMAMTAAAGPLVDAAIWRLPTAREAGLAVLAGTLLGAATYLVIDAFRYGEASFLAPFKYTALPWALLFDVVVWETMPSWSSLSGAALIIAAALLVATEAPGDARVRRGHAALRDAGPAAGPPTPPTG